MLEKEVPQVAKTTTGMPVNDVVSTWWQGPYVGHGHVSGIVAPCAGAGEHRKVFYASTSESDKALLLSVMLQAIGIRYGFAFIGYENSRNASFNDMVHQQVDENSHSCPMRLSSWATFRSICEILR